MQSILLEARVLPRAVVGLLEQPARLASWDSGALKNKPIVEYLEHMACPPTSSREETKRKEKMNFVQICNWSKCVGGAVCVCVMSADAKGSGRRRAGTLHSINK